MAFQKPYCAVTEHSNHILRDDLVSVINVYGVGGKVDKQFVDIIWPPLLATLSQT